MTSGRNNNVYILGARKPGTKLPPVDRNRIEEAKKEIEKLRKDIRLNLFKFLRIFGVGNRE